MKTQYEEFIHPQLHGIEYISSMFAIKPIQISSEKTDERNTLIQWQSNRHSIFLSSLVKYRHFMSLIARDIQ